MMPNRKQLATITAVVLTVMYSLRRWRSNSPGFDGDESDTEQEILAAD